MNNEKLCYFFFDIFTVPELGALSQSSTDPTAVQYSSLVLSILTSVIGLMGNTVVIYVTGFLKEKNKSKIWSLNLAVADFAFLLFNVVSVIIACWPFGSHVCKMYNFLFLVNVYASIYIITALNIDRALSVAKPMWHLTFFSQRLRYSICALIWVIALLCSVPAIIYSGHFELGNETQCSLLSEDLASIVYFYKNSHNILKFILHIVPREICKEVLEDQETVTQWNKAVSSTMSLVVPLVVIGYLIPLCIILLSNLIIAFSVKDSQTVASSRLYRLVMAAVMVFFCTRTPVFLGQIILLVAVSTMKFTLMYKVIVFLPLLSSISAFNSCLNPVVYVLVGKQASKLIINSLQKCNPFARA